jgi:hypothetical protein
VVESVETRFRVKDLIGIKATTTMVSFLQRLFSSQRSDVVGDEPRPATSAYQHIDSTEEAATNEIEDEECGDDSSCTSKKNEMQAEVVVIVDESLPFFARFRTEFVLQLKLAAPIMFTLMCESLPMVISMSFVGRYTSALHIDAVANAQNIYYVGGVAVGLGMSGVLETLATQSRGAGNPMAVGFFLVSKTTTTTALRQLLVYSVLRMCACQHGVDPECKTQGIVH